MTELESVKLFRGLNADEMQSLRRIAQKRQFPAGYKIFHEDDVGDGVYIIADGLVEIAHLVTPEIHRVFSRLGPGEIFGEMAVIECLPRSATAVAAKDTRVYFIPQDDMRALLQRLPVFAFNVLQEISQRLREFNQLHLREIIQAERLAVVGNFARSIIHDLKTPLTIIGLTAEIMAKDNTPPEKRAQALARIRRQVERVSDMIGDVLEFTQSRRDETALALTNYRNFVRDLLIELQAEAAIKSTNVELENEPPAVQVLLDPRRLRRVFFNLVHNATDVMPRGGRIILRFRQDAREVVTEIEDTGSGISPEIADRLFQAFATAGKAHGTGLGLSICKKIIEDHYGHIWARNEPGRGAIFSFALPLPKQP
jgi:signal transduction histidine kinase